MSTSALSIAVSALRAQSYAIETTSNNIANAATPGYKKQRVELKAGTPREGALGIMGSGVEAQAITQATDRLADLRVRSSSAQASYFGTRGDIMQQAETVFGEPDQGISKELTNTWNAFAALSVTPTDDAAKYQVLSALQGVAARVNQVRTGLDQLQSDANTRLQDAVTDANATTARLAQINTFARMPGGLPSDLADERDMAIDQLASTLGAQSTITDDGRVRVTLNGLAIVDDERSIPLGVSATSPGVVTHPAGAVTPGGTVGGLSAAITTDVANARTQLDSFVSGFVSTLNTAHAAGFTPSGAPGGPLLADSGGVLSVVVTQPSDIAATSVAGQTQNGNAAAALGDLRDTQGAAFQSVVTQVSGTVAGLNNSSDTAQSVADAASAQRESSTGVNIDEEMTDLVSQQRAYEAAARLVSVIDDMLKTLVNM
ncbi:MAG: flagellar hook-associated protein FlgK [Ilumatobacteraceae bacterium]|nr:flagellar hook-associated protein FlgK [Ilumatobacteraceae bacterium]